jgi:hypothetical protein
MTRFGSNTKVHLEGAMTWEGEFTVWYVYNLTGESGYRFDKIVDETSLMHSHISRPKTLVNTSEGRDIFAHPHSISPWPQLPFSSLSGWL